MSAAKLIKRLQDENAHLRELIRRIAETEPKADEGAFWRCAMCGCVWPGTEPHETNHTDDCVWMAAVQSQVLYAKEAR